MQSSKTMILKTMKQYGKMYMISCHEKKARHKMDSWLSMKPHSIRHPKRDKEYKQVIIVVIMWQDERQVYFFI
jgi:hypothetical protein